ncbi:MAG: hypothetical protein K2Q20_06570 [Phycisphaerales bacterium]|nr:hypothetical protein [Phycisphaerales bacterium]
MSLNLGTQSVRDRLLRKLAEVVHALPIVGMTPGPEGPYLEAAGRSPAAQQRLYAHTRTGKFAVELEAGPSVVRDPERTGILEWDLPVVVVGYLPDPLPEDPYGEPGSTIAPSCLAGAFLAAMHRLFDLPTDDGRLTVLDGGNVVAQAQHVNVVSGGDVGLGEDGTRFTLVSLEIRYRTRRGQPEVYA